MKKTLLFWITVLLTVGLYANPNPSPRVAINELIFTSQTTWEMEVNLFYTMTYYHIDSAVVQSSSGSSGILGFNMSQGGELMTFNSSCLSNPLTINPNGDTVSVAIYFNYFYPITSGFSFGTHSGAVVKAPGSGQSISRFELVSPCQYYSSDQFYNIYSLTSQPTYGANNDTTGAMSTMKGILYDMHGHPVPNETFAMDFEFTTDSTGSYSTRVYSRIKSWDTICYQRWPGHFEYVTVSPVSYSIGTDTVITMYISLTSNIVTGTPIIEKSSQDFNIFPNPVKNLIMVSYSSDLGSSSYDLSLIIFDVNGKKVLEKNLESSLGVANIPVDLTNGMYLATLKSQGRTLGTVHFVVEK